MALIFSVAELRREIQAFRGVSRAFLAPEGGAILETCEANLSSIAASADGSAKRWGISMNRPLVTRESKGEYQRDGRGSEEVHAEMTFVWLLEPYRKPGNKGKQSAKFVKASGIASTMIRIVRSHDHVEQAMWRMEVADSEAPGAHFHVQVLGRECDEVFPHSLDVPRLPSVLNSPFAAMEFALGELFQDAWLRHVQKESSDSRSWAAVQKARHLAHLNWVNETILRSSTSPWIVWKNARPPEELFVPL